MRVVPRHRLLYSWLPLLLSAAVVAGAAVLGLVQSGSPLSLARVMTATAAAQSARFSDVSVISSSNPDLRSRSSATGALEFATGNGSSVMTSRSVEYSGERTGPAVRSIDVTTTEQRVFRGRTYSELNGGALNGPIWIRLPAYGDHRGLVGSLEALDATSDLGLLSAPEQDLELVATGTSTVGGVPVRGYRVELADPKLACAAGVPVDRSGRPTVNTEIWVDSQDRLRQVRTTMALVIPRPPPGATGLLAPANFSGKAVAVTTLQLGSFSQPVHVVAPHIQSQHVSYSSAEIVATCDRKAHR
jgi:hypothetical protein